jgi:ABC-type glycerol-3-phosphate transport system substrate-binding protein
LDGTVYNDRIYGIWAWTDVRGIWYWKDMISQAGVDPNTLKTWDGVLPLVTGGGSGGQGNTPFIDIPTAGNNVGQQGQSVARNTTANTSALR